MGDDIHLRPYGRAGRGEIHKLGIRGDTHGLIELLDEPEAKASARIRERILLHLAQNPHADVVPAAAPLLENDPNKGVRALAAHALAATRTPAAAAALATALSDPHRPVRIHAFRGLGGPHAAVAVPALVQRLRTAPRRADRARAAETLGLIGSADALPALVEALTTTRGAVRIRAIQALGRIGDERALAPLRALADRRIPSPSRRAARHEALALEARSGTADRARPD